MYGTLLIQYLKARKSVTLGFFHPKLQYQTIYFFVLDVNQVTIAKMDNFSLLQFFERIPELRFKFMGSYPSDKLPQLTQYSFAIAKYSFAILQKRYRRMVPRKLQKTDNLCGFYAIYSAFLLFKFYQINLNKIHDVQVSNFISNFM